MPQQDDIKPRGQDGLAWVGLFARALATSLEVVLHDRRTFGERYFGLQSALAVLVMFLFPIFYEGQDPFPLYLFMVVYLFLCAAARGATIKRRLKGEPGEHSHYSGRPHMSRLAARIGESRVKGFVEPMLACVAGAMISEFSPPLGGYLILAGIGLFISVQLTLANERRRVLDLNDAHMEQRHVAEQWRRMRRD